jgi:hypothetical protein
MPTALFTVNDDTSDQGYDADAEDVLTLRLKQLPPAGVATVLFQVWSPGGFDSALGIAANPPRSSPGAPQLTLEGATSGPSVSPVAIDGTVAVALPSEVGNSWIVRCVVNGGMGTLPDGRTGPVAGLVHERMIAVRDGNGCRAVIPTETTQYDDDGWAGALNEMRTLLGGGAGGVPDPLTVGAIFGPGGTPGSEAQIDLGPTQISIQAFVDESAVILLTTLGASYVLTAHEHSWLFNGGSVAIVRALDDGGTVKLGFFGVEPASQPSITLDESGASYADQIISALAALGLVADDRFP